MTLDYKQPITKILSEVAFNRLKITAKNNQWLSQKRSSCPGDWPSELVNPKKFNSYLVAKLQNNPMRLEKYIKCITNRIIENPDFDVSFKQFVFDSNLSTAEKSFLTDYLQDQKILSKINLEVSKNKLRISSQTIETVKIILESNLDNLQNPCIPNILIYVEKQLLEKKPLDLAVINCLKRNDYAEQIALPSLFEFKNNSQKTKNSENIKFFDSDPVSVKGWAEIKLIIQKLKQTSVSLKPTIYLADTDFYFLNMDNFRVWTEGSQALQQKFEQEISTVLDKTQEKADKYFGEKEVEIKRLSSIVDTENFDNFFQEFSEIQALKNSETVKKLAAIRTNDYIEIWNTKNDLQNCGFSEVSALGIIQKEVATIVAQYAYEAGFYPGLFGFAESTKDSFFCFNSFDPFGESPKPVFILNRRKN